MDSLRVPCASHANEFRTSDTLVSGTSPSDSFVSLQKLLDHLEAESRQFVTLEVSFVLVFRFVSAQRLWVGRHALRRDVVWEH